MSVLSLLVLRYRGTFLIAPSVSWAIFFAGATWIQLKDLHGKGSLTHHGALQVFVTHGLVSVILGGALLVSGILKETG